MNITKFGAFVNILRAATGWCIKLGGKRIDKVEDVSPWATRHRASPDIDLTEDPLSPVMELAAVTTQRVTALARQTP